MKTAGSVKAISVAMTIVILFVISFSSIIYTLFDNNKYISENKILEDNKFSLDIAYATYDEQTRIENMNISENVSSTPVVELSIAEGSYEEEKVYDNMTLDELAEKLKMLNIKCEDIDLEMDSFIKKEISNELLIYINNISKP